MLLTADIHLHNFNAFALPSDKPGLNSRALDILKSLEIVLKEGIKLRTSVIIAGDLFLPRNNIDVPLYLAMYELLKKYSEEIKWQNLNTKIIIIPGNHDRYSKAGDIYLVKPFNSILNVKVTTNWDVLIVDGLKVACAPCRDDEELLYKDIEMLKNEADILVTHTPIFHARVNKDWRLTDGLRISKLRKWFKWAFFGDIHNHQKLVEGFYTVGAPVQHTFNDEGSDRGYLKFDGKKIDFIHLNKFPVFRTVLTDDDTFVKEKIKEFDFVRYISKVSLSEGLRNKIKTYYGNDTQIIEALDFDEKKGRIANIKDMDNVNKIVENYLFYSESQELLDYEGVKLSKEQLMSIVNKCI